MRSGATLRMDRGQRGFAALVLMVILALGGTYMIVSGLNAASRRVAEERIGNADVLSQAKLALIGYVAQRALLPQGSDSEVNENNPGRLPCPEAPGYYGTSNEGKAAAFCSPQAIGRLPWRTLGLDKLTDAYGEPLWYVVSSGWALPNSSTTLTINSNSLGQLSVDGQANAAVALIIAPGPAMNIQTATGCAARVQTRNKLVAPNFLDYLECDNATSPADSSFVTTGPATSFNDQVLQVTTADLLPGIEASIAKRIESEVVPTLKGMYASSSWSTSSTNPVFPYAVAFTDPSTSTFLGASGVEEGLLPVFTAATDPTRVVWYRSSETYPPSVSKIGGAGVISATDCAATSTTAVSCAVTYSGDVRIMVAAAARRVARTMRQLNAAAIPLGWADPGNPSLNVYADFIPSSTSGAAYIYVQANLPNSALETITTVTVPIGVLVDHPLTDPNNATTGWFVRNNWHHLLYYAFAPNFASNQTRFCNPPPDAEPCLTVSNLSPTGKQRAILLLAGRPLAPQTRPSSSLDNYLEDAENRDANQVFAKLPVSKTNNDRIVVVDANP